MHYISQFFWKRSQSVTDTVGEHIHMTKKLCKLLLLKKEEEKKVNENKLYQDVQKQVSQSVYGIK